MPNYTRRRRFSVQSEFVTNQIPQIDTETLNIKNQSQTKDPLKKDNATRKLQTANENRRKMQEHTKQLQVGGSKKMYNISDSNKNLDNIAREQQQAISQIINNDNITDTFEDPIITELDTDQVLRENKRERTVTDNNISSLKKLRASSPSLKILPKKDSKKNFNIGQQHHVKVRSQKRCIKATGTISVDLAEAVNTAPNTTAIGVDPIIFKLNNTKACDLVQECLDNDRASSHSIDDMCRICHGGDSLTCELGLLISACACRGTVGRIHVKCLERWLTESGKSRCELCGTRYATKRVHRYGFVKALFMWILSQNAKQLLIDVMGIMLMSPLAVLAAWLSGRTLAGLMTQDHGNVSIWPLASTFVLACLTLVCYYCWIVSAATRHALGWWIWYRSQYEVRLELQELVENLLNQDAF